LKNADGGIAICEFSGESSVKLGCNAWIAGLIFPVYSWLEIKLMGEWWSASETTGLP